MKTNIRTLFTIGMMITGFMYAFPVYAQENDLYTIPYQDPDDLTSVFKAMYSSKIGTMKYKKTETNQTKNTIRKIMTYESNAYQIKVSGLDVNQKGNQEVTVTLSKKTGNKVAAAKVDRAAVQDSMVILDTGMVVEDKATIRVDDTSSTTTISKKQDDFYQKIVDAARSQVGTEQDCTMLVTNSLTAVGIHFHGAPEQYTSLGTMTKDPVPGDICVYQGHVAVYIGNGQAVHGGWDGHTTTVFSVNCNNPLIGYIHVDH